MQFRGGNRAIPLYPPHLVAPLSAPLTLNLTDVM